jgi:hypothetical protein
MPQAYRGWIALLYDAGPGRTIGAAPISGHA